MRETAQAERERLVAEILKLKPDVNYAPVILSVDTVRDAIQFHQSLNRSPGPVASQMLKARDINESFNSLVTTTEYEKLPEDVRALLVLMHVRISYQVGQDNWFVSLPVKDSLDPTIQIAGIIDAQGIEQWATQLAALLQSPLVGAAFNDVVVETFGPDTYCEGPRHPDVSDCDGKRGGPDFHGEILRRGNEQGRSGEHADVGGECGIADASAGVHAAHVANDK